MIATRHISPAAALRFLCDEMLRNLGRYLRAAGYDTAIAADGSDDEAVLAHAAHEKRLLLTRDRELADRARQLEVGILLLAATDLDGWALELRRRLELDWLCAPFQRCLVDNAVLVPASDDAMTELSRSLEGIRGPINRCPLCARFYWRGSHVRRMEARLETWRNM